MVVPGNLVWKLPAMADAVLEDKLRHAHPIGTVELTCPFCNELQQMNCYRIARGPVWNSQSSTFSLPLLR